MPSPARIQAFFDEPTNTVTYLVSDPQTRRAYRSALGLTEILAQVPVHVIPCLQRNFDSSDLMTAASAWASIVPAGWSFLVALRSRGLGSVWTTMQVAQERQIAELLDIPSAITQAALFPVTHTLRTESHSAASPPAKNVTFWDGWGKS